MSESNDLLEIEKMAGALLASLGASQRRSILRGVARDLRKSQRDRIGAQSNPDGSAFAPRKAKSKPIGGSYAVRFLYPSAGGGKLRVAAMKSWSVQGPLITGFDTETGSLRSFFRDKIQKWLPVEDGASGSTLRRRGSVRRKAMFRKLRLGRHLRSNASDLELWVGFSGIAGSIANIHQEGGEDRPNKNAKSVRYPRRILLGISNADRTMILDSFFKHLELR